MTNRIPTSWIENVPLKVRFDGKALAVLDGYLQDAYEDEYADG